MRGAACALLLSLAGCDGREAALGRALFVGEQPLVATVAGTADLLPPDASRCANCHVAGEAAAAADAAGATAAAESEATRTFGPPLTAATLRTSTSRRGGPPSRYDVASFCRLLRTGVDPAYVLIDTAMPRYRVDDAGCAALWRHLAGRS